MKYEIRAGRGIVNPAKPCPESPIVQISRRDASPVQADTLARFLVAALNAKDLMKRMVAHAGPLDSVAAALLAEIKELEDSGL